MPENQNNDKGGDFTLKGRGRESLHMYAATDSGSAFARQKAEAFFKIMKDENATYDQRAEVAGVTPEQYRRADAIADMTNYLLMEAYKHMMEQQGETAQKNYYAEILQGLDRLLGVDGLTEGDIKQLKKMWTATAGGSEPIELKTEERQKIDEIRAEAAKRKANAKGGPVPRGTGGSVQ